MSVKDIEQKMLTIEFVDSLHHTHIWSLEGENHVFTTHVKLKDIKTFSQLMDVKEKVKQILSKYPFRHYTIETELDDETCDLLHETK